MARTKISDRNTIQLIPTNKSARTRLKTKLDEHDTALDSVFAVKTVTVLEATLTGTSQAVNIGTALPAGAVVLARQILVNTQFVLAGNDLTITIGGTDADGIVASTDLDALTAGAYQGTAGANPTGNSYAGQQLTATFAASNLASLSAGSVTISIWYGVITTP